MFGTTLLTPSVHYFRLSELVVAQVQACSSGGGVSESSFRYLVGGNGDGSNGFFLEEIIMMPRPGPAKLWEMIKPRLFLQGILYIIG